MNKLQLLTIILIIIYIYLLYLVYQRIKKENITIEKFTELLDLVSEYSHNENESKKKLKNLTLIQPIKNKLDQNDINNQNHLNDTNNQSNKDIDIRFIYLYHLKNSNHYIFYNKNYEDYIKIIPKISDSKKTIKIEDIHKNLIGSLITYKYNIYNYQLDLYKKNLNMEFIDEYKSLKIYFDDGDKIFYIKHNKKQENESYTIFLFEMIIGKIKFNEDSKMYKIMVYKEYKEYLNLFGIGLVTFITNS